jgi:hypothetical protein
MTPAEEGRAAFEAGLLQNPYDRRSREGKAWAEAYRGGGAVEEPQVFLAVQSGVAHVDGQDMIFVKDVTRVSAGHPLLTTHPHLFRPVEAHHLYGVEQATAAPGERRAR